MWKALLSKELRECCLYAGLALLFQAQVVGEGMDLPLIALLSNGRGVEIPFVASYSSQREVSFSMISIVAAIIIGLHQTAWESWRQTTLFLLHRPLPRTQIFAAKIVAGSLLLLGFTAFPLLLYSLWAATPGTHASPFYWGMTDVWWRDVAVAWVCYLGAFLTGLRPANWVGSRILPLIAVLLISVGVKLATQEASINVNLAAGMTYITCLLLSVGLIVSIVDTARLREYP